MSRFTAPININTWLADPGHLPKLVRDHIPQILSDSRVQFKVATTSEEGEFRAYLTRKLIEEAHEVNRSNSNRDEVLEELADVMEVIDAICLEYEIERDDVLQKQEGKRAGRGAFAARLILLECE